jgi:hypothetical protein
MVENKFTGTGSLGFFYDANIVQVEVTTNVAVLK